MMVVGQYRSVLVDTLWDFVSIGRYWPIYEGTGPVWFNTCWYLVVLHQYMAVMVDTRWYKVSRRRYWLILNGTGSVLGDACWYLVVLDQYMALMVDTRSVEGTGWYLVVRGQ